MFKLRFLFLLLGSALCASAQQSDLTEPVSEINSVLPQVPEENLAWELVFNDEFNGAVLDLKKWKVYGQKEPFLRRDGFWTADAVQPNGNGHLRMKTYQDSLGNYLDACIYTEDIFEIAYGYFEIRVRLHEEEGHWPAFWLYSGDVFRVGRGGVDGAEIDIFEKFKTNRKVEHNVHWDGYGDEHQTEGKRSRHRKIMKGFHTFGMWWTEDQYRFYVDGKEVWSTDAGGICEVPLHILISDEIGSHRRMKSIEKASLPDDWLVDYVRIYSLRQEK